MFGITGTGKSNVVVKIFDELINHNKKVFIFDWKKQYRDYLSIKPDADVLIFGVGNKNIPCFQFNPLIPPPGIDPHQYLEHICQIVGAAYYCGEGVMSILRKAISSLYIDYGVYKGKAEKYPTFQDVLEYVDNLEGKGRSKDWQESTLRSLQAICHGGIGEIVNVQKPTVELSELLKQNIFLELGDLGQSQKKFIIQSLLFYIYYYTMNRGIREKLQNVIIIEEAHHILLQHAKAANEPITDIILKEIREFSTGIIIIDQNPSLISVPALANNYTTIGMYTKHGSDISALSRAMFLDDNQKEYLGKLECGYGIVKLAGRIFPPFLVKFPLMQIKKGSIKDFDVAKHMEKQGYSTNSSINNSYSNETSDSGSYSETDKREERKKEIIGKLLRDIDEKPFNGIASRNKRLRISPRKGKEAVNGLVKSGILNKVEIKENKNRRYLLEIKSKIREELIKRGAKLKQIDEMKEGGIEHKYWNNKIAEINMKKGYKVETEKRIDNNGYIDQVIEANGVKIAIEVETGKSKPIETIQRDLALGFDKVICVATSERAFKKIKSKLKAEKIDKDKNILLIIANQYSTNIL